MSGAPVPTEPSKASTPGGAATWARAAGSPGTASAEPIASAARPAVSAALLLDAATRSPRSAIEIVRLGSSGSAAQFPAWALQGLEQDGVALAAAAAQGGRAQPAAAAAQLVQ